MTPNNVIKFGFYSAQAVQLSGSAIYLGVDGEEKECTAVYSTNNLDNYLWADAVKLGELSQYLRNGVSGRLHQL